MMSYQELLKQLAQDRANNSKGDEDIANAEERLRGLVYEQLSCDFPLLDFDGASRGIRSLARAINSNSDKEYAVTRKLIENVATLAATEGTNRAALQSLASVVLRSVLRWATDSSTRISSVSSRGSDEGNGKNKSDSPADALEENKEEEFEEFEPYDDDGNGDIFGSFGTSTDDSLQHNKSISEDTDVLNALNELCGSDILGFPDSLDGRDGGMAAEDIVTSVSVFAKRAAENGDNEAQRTFNQRCLDVTVALLRDSTCIPQTSSASERFLRKLVDALKPTLIERDDAGVTGGFEEPHVLALLSILTQACRATQLPFVDEHMPFLLVLLDQPLISSRVTEAVAEFVSSAAEAGGASLLHNNKVDIAALKQCERQTLEPSARSHATEELLRSVLEGVCCRNRKAFLSLHEDYKDFEPFREHGSNVLASDVFTWDLLCYVNDTKSVASSLVLEPFKALLHQDIVESERGVLTEKYLQDLTYIWQYWKPCPELPSALRTALSETLARCPTIVPDQQEEETQKHQDESAVEDEEYRGVDAEKKEKWKARYARMRKMLLTLLHECKAD